MKIIHFVLILLVTQLLSGCVVSKSDSSVHSPGMNSAENTQKHSNTALSSSENENGMDDSTDDPEQDVEALIEKMLTNEQLDIAEGRISVEIINPDSAFSTLPEPWTLKQFTTNVSDLNVVYWNHMPDYHEDEKGTVVVYDIQETDDEKLYLVAQEHGEICNKEAFFYFGIRDYEKDNMVVNFYPIGLFTVSAQCGTSFKNWLEIEMESPRKVKYKGKEYHRIDFAFINYDEYDCSTDSFEYDENGEPDMDSCELEINTTTYKYIYLYKFSAK